KYTAKLSEKLRRLWQDGKLKQNILSLENKIAEYVSECKETAKWVYECIKSSLKKQTDANN
ncbi:MAG: hypothetical protein LBF25_00335, partial [Puniceicoccales bacterium]|nr:hypothetical protein [Puniceicoccales bacterium]